MSITGNSIYHITKLDNLKSILELKHFKINYCRETLETDVPNEYNCYAVPMVSFCDSNPDNMKEPLNSYKNYAIGLKKEWAYKNKLNPVIYLNQNSNVVSNLNILHKEIFKNTVADKLNQAEIALADLFRHIKNYKGLLIRENDFGDIKLTENYLFSNEKEWRYCPTIEELAGNLFIADSIYTNDDIKNKENYECFKKIKKSENEKISNLKLEFSIDDISDIIVTKDSERDEILSIFEDKSEFEKTVISSKIIYNTISEKN